MSFRVKFNGTVQSLQLRLKGLSNKRIRLYEDFTEGILDENEYLFIKSSYDSDYENLNRQLEDAIHL